MAGSLEANKIAAAVLTAGIVAMASGWVASLLFERHEEGAQHAYPIEGVAGGDTQVASAAPKLEPVLPLLATADVSAGESVAKKCTACHSFESGGPNKIGPNLYDVVGRQIAAVDGFNYSDALKGLSSDGWSYQMLNAYLENPKGAIPGNKMAFAGIKKVEDRANLIAYMRSLSGQPAPLPTAEEIQAVTAAAEGGAEAPASEATAGESQTGETQAGDTQMAAADGQSLGALLAAGDAEAGLKVARKCNACHTFDKDGANKIGPNLYGVVGRQIGGAQGFNYSKALQDLSGQAWSYEMLNSYLENPKDSIPGNKMAFVGLKKPVDRADVIAYLRQQAENPPPLPGQ